jgi:hypothetical protein
LAGAICCFQSPSSCILMNTNVVKSIFVKFNGHQIG